MGSCGELFLFVGTSNIDLSGKRLIFFANFHFDIDKTFFEDDGEKYSEKMLKYIKTLSVLQKEVVKLIISGYTPLEIREILHITQKEYNDCLESMASYKNISIFFYN